jgi:hypothetical protein
VLPAAFLRDRNQVLDHSIEWLHCVDLVGAGRAKERLDLRQVVQDEFALLAALAVAVGGPQSEPRFSSSAKALDLPVPDIPVRRIHGSATSGRRGLRPRITCACRHPRAACGTCPVCTNGTGGRLDFVGRCTPEGIRTSDPRGCKAAQYVCGTCPHLTPTIWRAEHLEPPNGSSGRRVQPDALNPRRRSTAGG